MNKPLTLKTIFGPMVITEPVLIDLINSRAMQRLKGINQYGITFFLQKPANYTRFDHSVGVMYLVHKAHGPLAEQIAGLLHDVSHTVFSHLADVIFDHHSETSSYQDDIHRWYLEKTDIPEILARYGYSIDDVMHKEGDFKALEQDLPDLCADRIEYLIHGGFIDGVLPHYKIQKILEALHFKDGRWYFTDIQRARDLALTALYLNQTHFAAPWNLKTYQLGGKMMKYALAHNLITSDELHFSQDMPIWKKLQAMNDPVIKDYLAQLQALAIKGRYSVLPTDQEGVIVKPKFRGVNPWVKTPQGMQRLTEVDTTFKHEFDKLKVFFAQGVLI